MLIKNIFSKYIFPLVDVLVLVLVLITIFTLSNSIIYCQPEVDTIVNFINNIRNDPVLSEFYLITLSNLECDQYMVGIPNNGYDIDYNQGYLFFQLFFQRTELVVEQVDGVYVNVFNIENTLYTVHPRFIHFLLNFFPEILF